MFPAVIRGGRPSRPRTPRRERERSGVLQSKIINHVGSPMVGTLRESQEFFPAEHTGYCVEADNLALHVGWLHLCVRERSVRRQTSVVMADNSQAAGRISANSIDRVRAARRAMWRRLDVGRDDVCPVHAVAILEVVGHGQLVFGGVDDTEVR